MNEKKKRLIKFDCHVTLRVCDHFYTDFLSTVALTIVYSHSWFKVVIGFLLEPNTGEWLLSFLEYTSSFRIV